MMRDDFGSDFDDLCLTWEGPEGVDLHDLYLSPMAHSAQPGGLNAFYLSKRKLKLLEALAPISALDRFTPDEVKGPEYWALQAAIFVYSARPVTIDWIPPKYEKLMNCFLEDKEQRLRHFKERDLASCLSNRTMLKEALRFLTDKGILEQIDSERYVIRRRPIAKLSLGPDADKSSGK
jgi:hypothetical protein